VLTALQGHSEAGALWEKHINKILVYLDIVYATYERSIYRGKIDEEVEKSTTLLSPAPILLWRKV
jgi:hypothetical protein